MKFEAFTLEEAITKASGELGCSVVDLDIKVLQHPNKGLLGLFKKNAIIEAKKIEQENCKKNDIKEEPVKKNLKKDIIKDLKKDAIENNKFESKHKSKQNKKPKVNINHSIVQIEKGLKDIFKSGCFHINNIEVSKFNDDTIFIKIDGLDAALLIGKEGYRYKALSYMLHNWIYPKYGYCIRFEIAEFLKNQEEMIAVYLKDIIEKIKNNGRAQTKPLDGVLVKIALEQLRKEFPDKYVGVRSSRHGKYIVVNDYKK